MAIELDYMEYATDSAAAAAYVSNSGEAITVSQLTETNDLGDFNWTPGLTGVSQGFKVSTADPITKFTWKLNTNNLSATGTLTGYIYSDNGSGLPNTSLATFSAITCPSGVASPGNEYSFTGTFTPTANTQYHMVVMWTGGSAGNIVYARMNLSGNVYADGIIGYYLAGWGAESSERDLYFKLYQTVLQSYSEATIKSQGTYSLKGIATTGALNKTLTRTIGTPIDLTGQTQIKFDIYAGRTGGNVKVGIRNQFITQSQLLSTGVTGIGATAENAYAQGFQVTITNVISKITLQLKKSTGATGTLTCYIYDDSSGTPNSVVATFSNIAVSSLTTDLVDYDFIGTYTPTASTQYHIVLAWTGGTEGDIIYLTYKSGNPYANGFQQYRTNTTWTQQTTLDLYFKIWQYVTTEKTHTIAGANTWETDTWDISAVADADKDAIDSIIVTITNADAANTFYLDNMFGTSVTNWTKDFSDAMTISEPSMIKAATRLFAETMAISEVIIKSPARELLETLTLSEVYSRLWTIDRVFSEVATLSEVISKAMARLWEESLTITDSVIKEAGRIFSETITAIDSLSSRTITRIFTEIATLTEIVAKDVSLTISEAISLVDTLTRSAGLHRTLTDTTTITDVFTQALKWLKETHIASVWNKVTRTVSSWAKATKNSTTWGKKYG